MVIRLIKNSAYVHSLETRIQELERQLAEAKAAMQTPGPAEGGGAAGSAESQRQVREILESIHDGFFALDREWRFRYVNRRAALTSGLDPDELTGENIWERWPDLTGTPLERAYRQAMDEGIQSQVRVEGIVSGKWYDVNVYPSSEGITVYFVDRTEQIQAEQALQASEQKYRKLVEGLHEGVWLIDAEGITTFVNQQMAEMLGYGVEEIIGRSVYDFMDEATAERARLEREMRAAGISGLLEHDLIKKDGSRVSVLIATSPVFDDEGNFAGAIAGMLDISERKQAEKAIEDYTQQLERSNRELEEFAFVASHDLQEPLRKIEAFSSILLTQPDRAPDEQRDYLERISKAAARMRAMVSDLLALSHVTTMGRPFEAVDLSNAAAEALSVLEVQIQRAGGRIEVEALPRVAGDPIQLHQLLQNLISNALKFHRPETPPAIRVYAKRPAADRVELIIEDNGIGFDEREAERLFQPFQRLHGIHEYEGSGMGLAICRKIAERHGGSITARSRAGEGSSFIVTLPAHVGPA